MDTNFTGEHALVDSQLTNDEIQLCHQVLELELICELQETIDGLIPPVVAAKHPSMAKTLSALKLVRGTMGAETLLRVLSMAPQERRLVPKSFASFLLFLLKNSAPTLKLPEVMQEAYNTLAPALIARLESLGVSGEPESKEEINMFNPSIVGLA